MDGKERRKVKVNGSLRRKGLRMQMRKRMWHQKRDLMQLNRDMGHINNRSIEVRALEGWSVGHVVRNTLRDIFHKIKVVGLRYIVIRGTNHWGCWSKYSTYLCKSGQQVGRTLGIYH